MLNTNYITYDGVVSIKFGLRLGSFESESGAQDTSIYSPDINTTRNQRTGKFAITNKVLSSAPEYELTLVSETTISPIMIRKIMRWLVSDGQFKKLIINRQDLEGYYAMCSFKDISEIKVNGYCVGFKMTAVLDSPYWYGEEETYTLYNGNYVKKEIQFTNKSDIYDYAYPQIKFILNENASVLEIINLTDDESRVFKLKDLPQNTEITIDNELMKIEGSGVSLDNFDTENGINWVRLVKGINNLQITINGEIEISCPQYSLIGF